MLGACGLTLAAIPAPLQTTPAVVTPAWCRNADVYAALADATGDITEELEACGVTLPTAPAPEPVIERVVETVVETVPCPKPEEFNGLDFEAQGPLLAACGLIERVAISRCIGSPVLAGQATVWLAGHHQGARPTG